MNILGLTCTTVLFAVMAVTVTGEPPRADAAPYPPSGWRPSGRQFALPLRQAPRDAYKAPPKEQYGAPTPAPSYGPPPTTTAASTTTAEPATTARSEEVDETTEETTDEPEYKDEEGADAGARAISVATAEVQEAPSSGLYYVLLPDGRLQRVAYTTTREDQQTFQRLVAAPLPINQGYLAVQYEDVAPVQAPVYAYGQQNTLVRIFK